VGQGRVRRATLEFYQIDSPEFNGAVVSLFRLKRPWTPDRGTWLSYDAAKKLAWAQPGASDGTDREATEEAKVTLDDKARQWRAWDITRYVQDVLSGKAPNHGFLMCVTNGEPKYHVRFYPETDLQAKKEAGLRPRVVLEISNEQ
jgi:hypothetical protein